MAYPAYYGVPYRPNSMVPLNYGYVYPTAQPYTGQAGWVCDPSGICWYYGVPYYYTWGNWYPYWGYGRGWWRRRGRRGRGVRYGRGDQLAPIRGGGRRGGRGGRPGRGGGGRPGRGGGGRRGNPSMPLDAMIEEFMVAQASMPQTMAKPQGEPMPTPSYENQMLIGALNSIGQEGAKLLNSGKVGQMPPWAVYKIVRATQRLGDVTFYAKNKPQNGQAPETNPGAKPSGYMTYGNLAQAIDDAGYLEQLLRDNPQAKMPEWAIDYIHQAVIDVHDVYAYAVRGSWSQDVIDDAVEGLNGAVKQNPAWGSALLGAAAGAASLYAYSDYQKQELAKQAKAEAEAARNEDGSANKYLPRSATIKVTGRELSEGEGMDFPGMDPGSMVVGAGRASGDLISPLPVDQVESISIERDGQVIALNANMGLFGSAEDDDKLISVVSTGPQTVSTFGLYTTDDTNFTRFGAGGFFDAETKEDLLANIDSFTLRIRLKDGPDEVMDVDAEIENWQEAGADPTIPQAPTPQANPMPFKYRPVPVGGTRSAQAVPVNLTAARPEQAARAPMMAQRGFSMGRRNPAQMQVSGPLATLTPLPGPPKKAGVSPMPTATIGVQPGPSQLGVQPGPSQFAAVQRAMAAPAQPVQPVAAQATLAGQMAQLMASARMIFQIITAPFDPRRSKEAQCQERVDAVCRAMPGGCTPEQMQELLTFCANWVLVPEPTRVPSGARAFAAAQGGPSVQGFPPGFDPNDPVHRLAWFMCQRKSGPNAPCSWLNRWESGSGQSAQECFDACYNDTVTLSKAPMPSPQAVARRRATRRSRVQQVLSQLLGNLA